MSTSDNVFDAVRELIAVANPGLVGKRDLERLEAQLEELEELVEEIEARLDEREREPESGPAGEP